MLTGRGGGLLLLMLLLWALGLVAGITALSLSLTAALLWFFLCWLLFLGRVRLARHRLRMHRTIWQEQGRAESLWAGLSYRVIVRIDNESWASLSFVSAMDRVPALATVQEGRPHAAGTLGSGESLELDYDILVRAAGTLRFEGVKVLVTDLEGFFAYPLFVRQVETVRCLPPLADARGRVPAVKRINILPLLGSHPHRRPGSGIELLELRDYLPGDPPKRIAWKISARRDRLMTREVESEVPVRCTLFVDASDAVRAGPVGRNALARLIAIAGAVAQANAAARDLTGLCLFDETGVMRLIRPERGRRHLLTLVQVLAEHADLFPRSSGLPLEQLILLALGLAQDLYPELLTRDVNSFPWWLPLLSPRPAYLAPLPGPPPHTRTQRLLAWVERRLRDTPLGLLLSFRSRFSPSAHRIYRQRKQLSAVLAALYALGPAATAEMLEDDDLLRSSIERFLADHREPFPLRLFDDEGRYAFASPAKVEVLAQALLQSVRRGKDNELLVLLVDLLDIERLQPLLNAVRVARARHHEVLVVCPWPDDVPLPEESTPAHTRSKDAELEQLLREPLDPERLVQYTTRWRLHQAYARLRGTIGRAGVPLICARSEDTPQLILARMNRLRVLQRGAL